MKESENKCLSGTKNCGLKSKRKLGRNRRSAVRNIKRRQRRKRSHNRYYRHLRQLRKHRTYEDLCSKVEAFAVFDKSNDMDWKPETTHSNNMSQDVAEWHQKEQVAYWKSRALSLEYENRMLYKHLRDVYAFHIESYNNVSSIKNSFQEPREGDMKTKEGIKEFDADMSEDKTNLGISKSRFPEKSNENEPCVFKPPSEPIGKKRREEMEKLYGSNCPRIAGIETALQLNYEHNLSKLKPAYWPHLQLNLG